MQTILEGSFDHFPADQVLTFFSLFSHSGTLDVVSNEKRARLFFDAGVVIHAESNAAGDVDEILRDLFIWLEGSFAFSPELVLPEGVKPAATDLRVVIEQGLQRASEWKSLLALFPTEDIGLRVIEEPKTGGMISLSPEELKILLKIGAGRALGRLLTDMQRPALQLYPIVHRLESAGLLERIAAAPLGKDLVPELTLTVRSFGAAEALTVSRDLEVSATPVTLVNVDCQTRALAAGETGAADAEADAPPRPPTHSSPLEVGVFATSLVEPMTDGKEIGEAWLEPVFLITVSDGARYVLEDSVYSVGRDANSVIRINDASVSSNHARIVRGESGYAIEDLGSRNKTYVNGELLTTPRILANDDIVRVGKVIFTYTRVVPDMIAIDD
jgi:hypothetical protein